MRALRARCAGAQMQSKMKQMFNISTRAALVAHTSPAVAEPFAPLTHRADRHKSMLPMPALFYSTSAMPRYESKSLSCCGKLAPVAYSVRRPTAKPNMTHRPLPISFALVQPNTLQAGGHPERTVRSSAACRTHADDEHACCQRLDTEHCPRSNQPCCARRPA